MEQILAVMAFLGGFTFLAMGLSVANSIEAKESQKASNIMMIIGIIGILSFLIGFFGLLIMAIID